MRLLIIYVRVYNINGSNLSSVDWQRRCHVPIYSGTSLFQAPQNEDMHLRMEDSSKCL